jgi:hypothetical protein
MSIKNPSIRYLNISVYFIIAISIDEKKPKPKGDDREIGKLAWAELRYIT